MEYPDFTPFFKIHEHEGSTYQPGLRKWLLSQPDIKTLVETGHLAHHPEWRIFDCRHDLAVPELGERQYRESHIPGARFAHLDRDLSAPKTGTNGRHPLPDPKSFAAWLGAQGLKTSDQVVAYDAGSGAMAARLWWLLRWAGHEAVAVLDGGFSKWVKENRPLSAAISEFKKTDFSAKADPTLPVNVSFLESHREECLLLDARAPARYRGEAEPIDPVAGRIPGALNRHNAENMTEEGVFKSSEVLRTEFRTILGGRPISQVVNYCGSGVAACHNLLAMEIAGLPGARLYAGSWSEWIADPKRPIAR